MTEEQIKDGYDRLNGALAPPLDAEERVDRRVAARRRHRRTAVAGGCAFGVLAAAGIVGSSLGGDDRSGTGVAADPSGGPVSTLTLIRADGSTHVFDEVRVSCVPLRDGAAPRNRAEELDQSLRIRATSPRVLADGQPVEPIFAFLGVLEKIEGDRTFTFPQGEVRSLAELPVLLWLGDSGDDLRIAPGDATGTVRVVSASCDPVPELHLEVSLSLDGKGERPPVDLVGTLP
ncbi:hypothetical protein GCM10023350_33850 [Nocardioides endophyticus]|uniref:Uncharacterized protein n=1 Tax=Nocardioides endophyticus TaxID=1353775 RepID=A0ABP8Z4K5_9ACTN